MTEKEAELRKMVRERDAEIARLTERAREDLTIISNHRSELARLRAAVPKRITSWSQAWQEGDKAPAESPIDGWNACVDAFEAAQQKGGE